MTPDQYRREGAEAMRAYIANGCDPSHLSLSDNPTEFHAGYRHAAIQRFTAIRAIDVDEVLAGMPPAPDAVARLVEAAIAEYLLEPPFQTELERMGRKATARGMMVRLGIYEKFKEALAAMEKPQ